MSTVAQFVDMLSLIKEDLETHKREWTRPGFQALAVHRFGQWRMSVSQRPLRVPLSFVYRAAFTLVRNVYGIELPYTVRVGRRVIIEHQGGIVVHGAASVGDGTIIRQGVTIGNRSLERPHEAPEIGKYVNIGAGAVILGRVSVGNGATIGANAVVTRNVPAGAVAVGVPARTTADASILRVASAARGTAA